MKVVGVVRSPFAMPGQIVEVDEENTRVRRYLANGVLAQAPDEGANVPDPDDPDATLSGGGYDPGHEPPPVEETTESFAAEQTSPLPYEDGGEGSVEQPKVVDSTPTEEEAAATDAQYEADMAAPPSP